MYVIIFKDNFKLLSSTQDSYYMLVYDEISRKKLSYVQIVIALLTTLVI